MKILEIGSSSFITSSSVPPSFFAPFSVEDRKEKSKKEKSEKEKRKKRQKRKKRKRKRKDFKEEKIC